LGLLDHCLMTCSLNSRRCKKTGGNGLKGSRSSLSHEPCLDTCPSPCEYPFDNSHFCSQRSNEDDVALVPVGVAATCTRLSYSQHTEIFSNLRTHFLLLDLSLSSPAIRQTLVRPGSAQSDVAPHHVMPFFLKKNNN
jgi:hypothetical protein